MNSDPVRRRLFEENQGLVPSVLHRVCKGYAGEDLEIVGLMGLWLATRDYDPSKGKFSSYAWSYIAGTIKRELRDRSRMIRLPAYADEEKSPATVLLAEIDDFGETAEPWSIPIKLLKDALPPKHHPGLVMLVMHTVYGYTLAELSELEGLSPQAVGRRMDRARVLLRRKSRVRDWAGVESPE